MTGCDIVCVATDCELFVEREGNFFLYILSMGFISSYVLRYLLLRQQTLGFPTKPVGSRRHQEDDHLVSGFSDMFAGLQVSGNLETCKLEIYLVI